MVGNGTICFAGNQLPPTVMKQSQNVTVTKKDAYLSDDNLANEGSIT